MPRKSAKRVPFTYFLPYVGSGRSNQVKDRAAQKMTNKELAQRVGIGERTICRYKADGVAPAMFDRMCREIGKHPVELLGRRVYQEFFGNAGPNTTGFSILDDPILGEFAREEGWVDKAAGGSLHRPGMVGEADATPGSQRGGTGEGVREAAASDQGTALQGGQPLTAQQFYANHRRRDSHGHFIPGFRADVQYIPKPYVEGEEGDEGGSEKCAATG